MIILLNGINALSSGGSNVVKNIIKSLPKLASNLKFEIILPYGKGYENIKKLDNTTFHFIKRDKWHLLNRFLDIHFNISNWCKTYKADICFTLGDVGPAKLDIPHIVLLQQAILLYPGEDYESLWSFKDKLKFFYTRNYYKKMVREVDIFTVQTPVMAKRLSNLYKVDKHRIKVIPSALPKNFGVTNMQSDNTKIISMDVKQKLKLLFLSAGYPHKNHLILPKIAKQIVNLNMNKEIHFFLTLDSKVKSNKVILDAIKPFSGFITNLGVLDKNQVKNALRDSSALFLPTLVESFGIIYLEAIEYNLPILTSDRDFSKWICGQNAIYFDPLDEKSIIDSISLFMKQKKTSSGKNISNIMKNKIPNSWEKVSKKYIELFDILK